MDIGALIWGFFFIVVGVPAQLLWYMGLESCVEYIKVTTDWSIAAQVTLRQLLPFLVLCLGLRLVPRGTMTRAARGLLSALWAWLFLVWLSEVLFAEHLYLNRGLRVAECVIMLCVGLPLPWLLTWGRAKRQDQGSNTKPRGFEVIRTDAEVPTPPSP